MNKKIKTIAYSIFLMFGLIWSCNCVLAVEKVRAEEILTTEEELQKEANKKNKIYKDEVNGLGSDYSVNIIDTEKPELHIKSIGEIIEAKKMKKLEKEENQSSQATKTSKEDLIIDCDEMEYFEDRSELEARGNVKIFANDGTKAKSDKAIYNKENNTIKLINNVTIEKNNSSVNGDYMFIDLNEENALMNEPCTTVGNLIIKAKEGYAYTDRIENLNGSIELARQVEMELKSSRFTSFENSINDKRLVDFSLKKERSKPYKFKTKEIILRPEKDHDSLLMKNVDIYYNKRKILNVPSIELFTDKEMTYSELNFPPEFGSLRGFGTYFGLGYTFKLPKTYTMRITPALVYNDSKLGGGIIGNIKSDKMRIDAGWSTNSEGILIDGEYYLTNKLKFDVGRNVYKREWLNGSERPRYIAELSYKNSYTVKDLGNTVFTHMFSAGFVEDYRKKHKKARPDHSGYRYRYMAELRKPLYSFGTTEQDLYVKLSAVAQGMVSIYSETGDTPAMVRIGPTFESRIKRWHSRIAYFAGGKHEKSPYWFDEYRYGRQSFAFDESIILNRFISLGYRGTISPLKDNRQRDILTENRVYAIVGPEDFKIAFSYDMRRKNMFFDFLVLLGTDKLDLAYDKMTITEPEKFRKHQRRVPDKDINRVKVPYEDL